LLFNAGFRHKVARLIVTFREVVNGLISIEPAMQRNGYRITTHIQRGWAS
jgi:hypothetical protein